MLSVSESLPKTLAAGVLDVSLSVNEEMVGTVDCYHELTIHADQKLCLYALDALRRMYDAMYANVDPRSCQHVVGLGGCEDAWGSVCSEEILYTTDVSAGTIRIGLWLPFDHDKPVWLEFLEPVSKLLKPVREVL